MYDDTIKIILFGDESVDKYKTALTQRFLTNLFVLDQTMTIGVDFEVKSLYVDGQKIKLQIWDFGGAERLRFLLPTYLRGARGGLFVYDITNYSSIAHIDDWLSVIRKELRAEVKFPILVVGILPDESEERQVTTEQGTKLAESRNLNGYIECSPKTGEKVEKVFDELTRLILANEEYQTPIKIKKYEEFIVYYLKNTGDPTKLNITPKDEVVRFTRDTRIVLHNLLKSEGKKSSSKLPSKPPLHPPPPGDPTIRYLNERDLDIPKLKSSKLLNNVLKFAQKINSRIIAVALVQGKDTILYSTDNWDISANIIRVMSSWNSLTAQFIMISGVKYSILQCTPERLVATSIRGAGHILAEKDEDYSLFCYLKHNGAPREEGYPYIFTHPKPPDDFEPTPQSQIRTPSKEKDLEDEYYCQYCGRKLTKEKQFTHSCNRFYLG